MYQIQTSLELRHSLVRAIPIAPIKGNASLADLAHAFLDLEVPIAPFGHQRLAPATFI